MRIVLQRHTFNIKLCLSVLQSIGHSLFMVNTDEYHYNNRYNFCIKVADNTFLLFRLFSFLFAAASKSMLPTITLEAPQCLRCLGTK